MVSRSSSSYQPLAKMAVGEVVTPAVPRRNFSGQNAALRIQTICNEDKGFDEEENHEARFISKLLGP